MWRLMKDGLMLLAFPFKSISAPSLKGSDDEGDNDGSQQRLQEPGQSNEPRGDKFDSQRRRRNIMTKPLSSQTWQ
jgi:hypothetical protein